MCAAVLSIHFVRVTLDAFHLFSVFNAGARPRFFFAATRRVVHHSAIPSAALNV